MKKLVALLIVIISISLVACATLGNLTAGNVRYIERYITENVSYEIDQITIREDREQAAINIQSSSTAFDNFGDYAKQTLNAALAATADKSVILREIDVSITDEIGTKLLEWSTRHSYGDNANSTGTFFDRRIPGYTEVESDVVIDNLQQEVERSGAESPLYAKIHNYVVDRSPYQIDDFGVVEIADKPGHYRGYANSHFASSEDSEIKDNFEVHVGNIAFLLAEILNDVDLILDRVTISVTNLSNTSDKTEITIYAPFDEFENQSASVPATQGTTATNTVYWVSGGSVYHTRKSCPALADSSGIQSGTIAQSGKSRVCQRCG